MTELRRHPRKPLRQEVELTFRNGGTVRAVTRDLSIGGTYVEVRDGPSLEPGTLLTITFRSAPGGDYSLRARVQRLAETGLAMTFIDFSLEDLRFIETLLAP